MLHEKKCSKITITKEMTVKIEMRYAIPARKPVTRKTKDKCWRNLGQKGIPLKCFKSLNQHIDCREEYKTAFNKLKI